VSEYQYYEFQAIDRPLGAADRQALRALSTRARITATSFTNHYNWGDFKGDPAELMKRWFDLHLYLANWGTRRLMIRWPKRLVDRARLDAFLREVECAELHDAGDNLILDIVRDLDPEDLEYREWDEEGEEGSGWLAALAPLRADVLQGDLRLFYLLWLTAVEEKEREEEDEEEEEWEEEEDALTPDELEPLPGIGPMTASLEAFADFFGIDPGLVAAAAEQSIVTGADAISADVASGIIAALSDRDKTDMLMRLYEGDPHAATELRAAVRQRARPETTAPPALLRTVGELRARAEAIRLARERAAAEKAEAERRRRAEEAEKARRARLAEVARKGEKVWDEIESEIARRNPKGYDRAAELLSDLRTLAEERGTLPDFARHLQAIREHHAGKQRFIERLAGMG
jgi:hypothetical protein